MCSWCPQQFRKEAINKNINPVVIEHAILHAKLVSEVNSKLPPIFSLRHLSHLTNVDYPILRSIVMRKYLKPYKVFILKKREKGQQKRGYRVICIPDAPIMKVQRWIAKNILSCGITSPASFAYAKDSKIIDAAKLHCGCRWMLKLDVSNFFESFSEIAAYRVFRSLGYQPLISFELSRICTRLSDQTKRYNNKRWEVTKKNYSVINCYMNSRIGHLPQGAPTSPMLSNLAMKAFDSKILEIANQNDLFYTRYADDLCLSTADKNFNRAKAKTIINAIYKEMMIIGLTPNITKTQIIPPGARKIVLGLLVDGKDPKLSRSFRSKLRMHFYYLRHADIGPSMHAKNRGFDSVLGLKSHLQGLISYASQIDLDYASSCTEQMNAINWPL